MIILIGVDNTGKTSLKKHLMEKFDLREEERYATLPPKDYDDWFEYCKEMLEKHLRDPEEYKKTIIDRFYIDEFVYGPVLRLKIGITFEQQLELDLLFKEVNPLILWCDTHLTAILHNFKDRVQLAGVESNIKRLRSAYYPVLNRQPFTLSPLITFDYTVDVTYRKIDKEIGGYFNEC